MAVTQNAGVYALLIAALLGSSVDATQIVTQPFLGIERIYQTETSPRPLVINVAIIDLDRTWHQLQSDAARREVSRTDYQWKPCGDSSTNHASIC